MCNNVFQHWPLFPLPHNKVFEQWPPGHAGSLLPQQERDREADNDGLIKCSSLTLEREGHNNNNNNNNNKNNNKTRLLKCLTTAEKPIQASTKMKTQ
jgi:hypothetical protein